MTTVPEALQKGDTVAFVSPSGRLNHIFPSRIDRAKASLEKIGYHVEIIYNQSLSDTFSEAVLQRCEEVHAAFRNPKIKAVICTIGGLSVNELLPHLDYDLIKANPKIFVGYSDITLLHHALLTQANLRTFYGPAAIPSFGEYPEPLQFTLNHFTQVLENSTTSPVGPLPRSTGWTQEHLDWSAGADATRPRKLEPALPWKWLRQGQAKGSLYGGCLPSILQVVGTKYQVDYRGRILFLETPEGETDDGPFPLDFARSSMADLVNAGIISGIVGLVLGRPYRYDDKMRAEFEKMVVDQCYDTDFPILANVDVGHTDPMLTLPLNTLAALDSSKDEFAILQPAVTSRKR